MDVAGSDFCPGCGKLQPLENGDRDYFRALGLSRPSLNVDLAKLEESFHAKSRLFHPDRYQRKDPAELAISLERSAVVNKAYRTLRDPRSRAWYVLERSGTGPANPAEGVPRELAELYFDLQEVMADPEGADRVRDLAEELGRRQREIDRRFDELAVAWDSAPEADGVLKELRALLEQENYLSSMSRDLGRRREGESR